MGILNLFSKLIPQKLRVKFSDNEYNRHYQEKKKALEIILGPMYELVHHAVIPYALGGPVDIYFFTETLKGTALVTMELIDPDGTGPRPNKYGTFELIAFTKYKVTRDILNKTDSEFSKIELRIRKIFTVLANYSKETIINPKDTCEIPLEEMKSTYLIFDLFPDKNPLYKIFDKSHILLLCIEVFPSEMAYAMKNGTQKLLEKLQDKGYYPYSDLDRKLV